MLLKNSRVLVTGGAGFIGSALIETLLANDNEVVCLDNLSTGSLKNLQDFVDYPGFIFLEGDIRDPESCRKAAEGFPPFQFAGAP